MIGGEGMEYGKYTLLYDEGVWYQMLGGDFGDSTWP